MGTRKCALLMGGNDPIILIGGVRYVPKDKHDLIRCIKKAENQAAYDAGKRPPWNLGTPGSGKAKLNYHQVKEIRKRFGEGEKSRDLGAEFGVSHTTILWATRHWTHNRIPATKAEMIREGTYVPNNRRQKKYEVIYPGEELLDEDKERDEEV